MIPEFLGRHLHTRPLSKRDIWLARGIAVSADVLQILLAPFTVEGVFSPVSDGLDIAVAVAMYLLIGWHIAFVPSFLIKALPFADLAPTWTLAVLVATGGRAPVAGANSASLPLLSAGQTWPSWYDRLTKPDWTPSKRAIGLIWSLLYPIILISDLYLFVQVVRGRLPRAVAVPFALNLVANLLFVPLFFGLRSLRLALLDMAAVLATLLWGMLAVWSFHPAIAVVQIPYLAWVCVATILQLNITLHNAPGARAKATAEEQSDH